MSGASAFVESFDLMRRGVGDLFGPGMLLSDPARLAPGDRTDRLAQYRRILEKLAYPSRQMRLMILADWLQEHGRAGDAADVRLVANHAAGSNETTDHQLPGRLRDLSRRLQDEDVISFAADVDLAVESLGPLANSQTQLGGEQ